MLPLSERLSQYKTTGLTTRAIASGKLVRVVGLTLEATGCRAPIGSSCLVETVNGEIEAEVVGFSGENLFLMPSEQVSGVLPGAKVTPIADGSGIPVGMELLGRVVDGLVILLMVLVNFILNIPHHLLLSQLTHYHESLFQSRLMLV